MSDVYAAGKNLRLVDHFRRELPDQDLRWDVLRGLYSAAGGMQALSAQQDANSQNLSYALKGGYRRQIVQFEGVLPAEELVSPTTDQYTDFTPGIIEYTGRDLDAALNGPGFFSVMGPAGPLYTRNGTFHVNGKGLLVTNDGIPVEGIDGPISFPLDAPPFLEINPDGAIIVGNRLMGKLKITAFENPAELMQVGPAMFQAQPGSNPIPVFADVRQRHRELGNTTVVQEMVQMLTGSRQFEAAQRALRQISDTIALNTRPR
jgi:flagellar basal body rod protein FlgG